MFGNPHRKYEGPFRKKENWSFRPTYVSNTHRVYRNPFGPSTVVEVDVFGKVKTINRTYFPK